VREFSLQLIPSQGWYEGSNPSGSAIAVGVVRAANAASDHS